MLPAMTGTFTSSTRFIARVFPMFIALAVTLRPPEHRMRRVVFLAVFGCIHFRLLFRHVDFEWAG